MKLFFCNTLIFGAAPTCAVTLVPTNRRSLHQINNLWESSVKASLHIQWPKWTKEGKWLLYLVAVTSSGPQDVVCTPQTEISPLQHIQVGARSHLSLLRPPQNLWTQGSPGENVSYSQKSSGSRTKRELGEREAVGKASRQSGKNKVLVSGDHLDQSCLLRVTNQVYSKQVQRLNNLLSCLVKKLLKLTECFLQNKSIIFSGESKQRPD